LPENYFLKRYSDGVWEDAAVNKFAAFKFLMKMKLHIMFLTFYSVSSSGG